MKIKLCIIFAILFTAIGVSVLSSSTVSAAPKCGDTDFVGPCPPVQFACGDKNFVGPCSPIDYAKVDCATMTSYEGSSRCGAVKTCINDRKLPQNQCVTEWNTCRDKVIAADGRMKSTDRESCISTVATGLGSIAVGGDKKTSCAIEGIGWIVCPVMRFMSLIVDQAYNMVSFLLTTPAIDTSANSDMYKAWSIMRNFANVAFVIAFLVIIYSQMTSVGITNYGIKKMLPRLIVAAVLVNISYWVCAIAVDASNILGSSFKGLLEGASNQLYKSGSGLQSGGAGVWEGLTVSLLAGGAVAAALYVGLSALLPLLIAALLAIVTVVLVLTLRQALIIILIVISPLAFVAYLLPNTESLFKKWLGLFRTLLLMFPIVAIIFGGSALASTIITNSASGNPILQIMAAGVTVVPLFLTPIVMKTAGGVLNRFGGFINNPNKGPFDRMRKGAEGLRGRRKDIMGAKRLEGASNVLGGSGRLLGSQGSRRRRTAAWIAGSGASRELNREQKEASAKRALAETKQDYVVSRVAGGDERYAYEIAGPTGDVAKIKASAVAAQVKEFNEAVGAEKATMSRSDAKELTSIMKDNTSSEARRAAAAGQLMKVGSDKDIHQALDYLGTQPKDANGNFADAAMSSIQQQVAADMGTRKPTSLGAGDISSLNKGSYDGDFGTKIKGRLAAGKLSAEALSKTSADELDAILNYVGANNATLKADPGTAAAMKALENDIAEFRTNPQLAGRQPAHEIASRMDSLHGQL